MPVTIAEQLRAAAARLAERDDEGAAPRLEAELLMAGVLQRPRAFLFSHGNEPLADTQAAEFGRLLDRRLAGEPLAYLTGSRSFWTLELAVDPAVLIPRPETELLVEAALQHMAENTPLRVVDLGTGSGAIALALAAERPNAELVATDISKPALEIAGANARRNGLERVTFLHSDWFAALEGPFDLVVSNPPYVADDDPHLSRGDCRFEPRGALTPGADALLAYRRIVSQAREYLNRGGWLLFEHGFDQGAALRKLLTDSGYIQVESRCDLQGHERVTLGQLA